MVLVQQKPVLGQTGKKLVYTLTKRVGKHGSAVGGEDGLQQGPHPPGVLRLVVNIPAHNPVVGAEGLDAARVVQTAANCVHGRDAIQGAVESEQGQRVGHMVQGRHPGAQLGQHYALQPDPTADNQDPPAAQLFGRHLRGQVARQRQTRRPHNVPVLVIATVLAGRKVRPPVADFHQLNRYAIGDLVAELYVFVHGRLGHRRVRIRSARPSARPATSRLYKTGRSG